MAKRALIFSIFLAAAAAAIVACSARESEKARRPIGSASAKAAPRVAAACVDGDPTTIDGYSPERGCAHTSRRRDLELSF